MAFPSKTGSVQDNVANAWEQARQAAGYVKARAVDARAAANGTVASDNILAFAAMLYNSRVILTASAAVPGIVAYAREQINDPTFDVVAEFNAMVAALDAVVSWIVTNFPKDGSGNLLAVKFNGDNSGRIVQNTFTTNQLGGLRIALDALIASIN